MAITRHYLIDIPAVYELVTLSPSQPISARGDLLFSKEFVVDLRTRSCKKDGNSAPQLPAAKVHESCSLNDFGATAYLMPMSRRRLPPYPFHGTCLTSERRKPNPTSSASFSFSLVPIAFLLFLVPPLADSSASVLFGIVPVLGNLRLRLYRA